MKRLYYITLLFTASLLALPQGSEVVSGEANLTQVDEKTLRLDVSDKAILRHERFHVGEGEHVEFIQPSEKSTVLNRVSGKDLSEILGKLSSNGRVFLINPNGICFGPNALINTGSFLASTLNIRDEDFLSERYEFFMDPGAEKGRIVNLGSISASPEGFVALFAPWIENRGSILARAGRVALGAAERVAIDFSGDGLIQFSVDGELEKALIEQAGLIDAKGGIIDLSAYSANQAMKRVVNTDGIEPAVEIEVEGGTVRLLSRSQTKGDRIVIQGDEVELWGAEIDASRDEGGGTVLIGGNYQGKGPERNARRTWIDEESVIRADAVVKGDGGRVIVWAEDTAHFDGIIYARGGTQGGDGGFVETSGRENLSVHSGNVNTVSPNGRVGTWLMDPASITIVRNNGNQGTAGLNTAATCTGGGFNLNDTTINNAASTVILCTAGLLRFNNGAIVNITTAGVGLTMASTSNPSSITFQTGAVNTWSIVTNNGPLTFGGPVTIPTGDTLSLSTSGGNISFNSTIDGAGPAVINAGAGTATFTGNTGSTTALSSLSVTAATINVNANVRTNGGLIALTGAVSLANAPTLDTTNTGGTAAGANITFSDGLNGATALTLRAGTAGNVIFTGIVGGSAPLTNIVFTSANQASIGNNITVSGANTLNFSVPVLLTGPSTITSNNASVTFATTLNGGQALTVSGGSGTTTLNGVVGGAAPLSSLSVTAAAINVNANITSNGGIISMTGPVAVTNGPTFDATSGAATGADISFSSTLNGASSLVFKAGTAGNVVFGGAVGNTAPPTNLTFTSANQVRIGSNITVSGANPLIFPVPVFMTGTSTITSNNATLSFSSTLNGSQAVTLNGGTAAVTMTGAVGGTPLSSLTITNSGALNFSSTVNITGALTQTNAATGTTTFSNTVIAGSATLKGTSYALNNSFATTGAAAITNSGTLTKSATGAISAAGGFSTSGAVNLANDISTVNTALSIGSTLTIAEGAAPVLTSGSGALTISGAVDGTGGGGGESLTINAAGGVVNLGALGSGSATSLSAVTITNSAAITFNAAVNLTGALTQTNAATGTTTFSNTVIAGSATLRGTSYAVNNSFTVSGAIAVTNSATFSKNGTGTIVAPGGFSASGNVSLASSITTTNTALLIGGNLSLAGTSVLSTQGAVGAGNITISGTTNGAQSLTLTGGTGTISFGAVGGTTPLTSFSATGATLNLNGGIATAGGTVNLAGAANINTSLTVDTTNAGAIAAGAGIAFSSTIDGAVSYTQDLTLRAGAGTISFGGAVGGTTPLRNLTVVSAGNWTAGAMTAASILQSAGSGTTTFNGLIDTNATAGIVLTGTAFNWNQNITTTNSGPLTVTHTGTLTIAAGVTLNIDGAYSDLGPGPTVYSGGFNIVTNGSNVIFANALNLGGTSSISTGPGVGDILFQSTVNGNQSFTLLSGLGNIVFSGAVGGVAPLNVLTITSANNVTAAAVSLVQFSQLAGTGTTILNGAVAISGASGFAFTGNNLTINSTLSTALGGTAAVSVAGTCVLGSGAALSLDGAFTQSGIGTVQSAGTITTTNDIIQFAGAVSLTGNTVLNTGAGAGNILFSSTLDGPGGLSLTAGTGNVTFSGAAGGNSRLGALLINSAANINTAAVTASSVIANCSATATLTGAYNTNGASGIQISANTISRSGTLTTTGTGSCTFTNGLTFTSTGNMSIAGAFTQNGAGPVTIQGTIAASGGISVLRAITQTGALIFDSSGANGPLTLSSTVNGTGAGLQDLTLIAGSGTITLNGALGGTTRLRAFTISSAGNASINQTVDANSVAQSTGSGTTTFSAAVTTTAAAGVSLEGAAFILNAPITTTTGPGPMTVINAGTLTINAGGVLAIGGTFSQIGTGSNALMGSVTAGGTISFARAIVVSGTASLTTTGTGFDINLSSTVDGGGNFTLDAKTLGNITVSGNIGSTTRLGALVFTNANNITVQNITAASLQQVNGQGTTTFQAINTNTIGGIVKNGTNFVRNGSIVTTNGGPLHITNTGTLTAGPATTATIDGYYLQDGIGAVNLRGSITTNNQPISFAGPVTLLGATVLSTGPASGDISFTNTINGGFDLTLTAGTGNISATQPIGASTRVGVFTINSCTNLTLDAITAGSMNFTESGGTATFNGDLNANTIGGITVSGATLIRQGSVDITNGGPLTVTFSGASLVMAGTHVNAGSVSITNTGVGGINFGGTVTTDNGGIDAHSTVHFLAPAVFNTSDPGGAIHFFGGVDGATTVSLQAGSGNIFFDGAVSGTNDFTIVSANDVTAALGFTAGSFTQSAGTGTTTFSGALSTSKAAGIVINTANFIRGSTITTTAAGPLTLTINPGGVVTSTASGSISLDGALTESGAATVYLAGSITTTNDNIAFGSPIVLTGTATLNSGTGGDISLAALDGAFPFNITATRDFSASGSIGSSTRIGAMTVTSCRNFTVQSLTAASLNMVNSTGNLILNGDLNTNAIAGIVFNINNLTRNGAITATNGGPLTTTFSGTITGTSSSPIRVGSLSTTKTAGGTVNFTGSVITDTGGIAYHSPVHFVGASTFDISAASTGDIHFYFDIDGAQNVNLIAGNKNIFIDGAVGTAIGATALSTLTITSAASLTVAGAVAAAAVIQTAGSVKTTFSDAISTTDVAGISLTGAAFELTGAVTTASGGPLLISNTGLLTLTGNNSIGGALTQTGAGTASLAGTSTIGGAVSFASAATLTGSTSLDTSANGGGITFSSTLAGGSNPLTLNAGTTGNIVLGGALSGLGNFTISNAANVTSASLSATTITQSAGTGLSTFGNLTTSAVGGISLTGAAIAINGDLITTSLGPVAITHTGALTLIGGANTSITGAFTQSGGGAVGLSGTILTLNQPITFTNSLSLNGTTAVSNNSGSTKVWFKSTINGAQNLTLTAGSGQIQLDGAIGGTTPLGALAVASCGNITYPTSSALSLTQSASSGTTTLSSPINTSGSGGISITGTIVNQTSPLTAGGTGSIAIAHTGLYTIAANVSAPGGFTESGSGGSVSLSGSISTSSANLLFTNAITLAGASSLSTGAGGGNIHLISTVAGGSNNLTLTAGTGAVQLDAALSAIGTFTIVSGSGSTTGAISADHIIQSAGSTTFGALTTSGALGISLNGTSFTLGGNVVTTAAGPLTIQNSGASVLSGAAFSIDGAVTQSGTGGITLSSAITSGGVIQFVGPVALSGTSASLTTSTGITFTNTVNGISSGVGDLSLDAGSLGNISFLLDIGSTLRTGALTVTNANNFTAPNITAVSFYQVDGQGTSTFANLNTNGSFGIVKNGNNFVRNGSIVTTNGGPLHVTNRGTLTIISGAGTTVDGHYLQDGAGAVNIRGTITTNNQFISFAGPLALAGALTLNTGLGAGDITFSNTVNGAFDLNLTAGTGSITASDAIGGTTRIGILTVNSCTDFYAEALTAASIDLTETGGTVTLHGDVDTNTVSGIHLDFNNLIRNGSILAINGGLFRATFAGVVTVTNPLATLRVGSFDVIASAGGGINFRGGLIADTGGISVHCPLTLTGTTTFDTHLGDGTIHFYDVLKGSQNVEFIAGSGDLIFDTTVGNIAPLSQLKITSARNVSASSTIQADSILQSAGTGTTTFSGAVTTSGSSGISIATANMIRGAAMTTTGTGPLTLVLSSGGTLTSTAAGDITVDGPFTTSGAAVVNLSGSLITTNSDIMLPSITFNSPLILAGATTFNTGSGSGNLDISVATVNGAAALNITAGTGDFTASGGFGDSARIGALTVLSCTNFTVQSLSAASIDITETGGTVTFNGDLNTNGIAGMTVHATNIFRGGTTIASNGGPFVSVFSGTSLAAGGLIRVGSLSTTRTGGGGIVFGGTVITETGGVDIFSPMTLVGAAVVDTSLANGAVHFHETVDGAKNATVIAGSGNVFFDQNVGHTTPIGVLTITSAGSVTAAGELFASSIVQTAGSGKTTFAGAVSTTAAAGIALTGTQFEFDGLVTTANGGPLLISNSGLLSYLGGGSLSGALSQTGAGAVSISGTTSAGGAVSFASAASLTGSTSFDTSANASNITFSGGITGANNSLLLEAGTTGNIVFGGALSGLGDLTISDAANVTGTSISAATITQSAGTGLTSLGNLTTSAVGGIALTGKSFSLSGNLITTSLGPVAIVNTGALTLNAGASTSISGAFSQSGGGAIFLAGTLLTINQPISFTNDLSLAAAASVSSGTGMIAFSGNIDGNKNLTLLGGDLSFGPAIGGNTPLSTLTIQNCANITYPPTFANSIIQNGSSVLTQILTPNTLTATTFISLTGTTITQTGTLTTLGSAPIAITNSDIYTMSGAVNSAGLFLQAGGGAVHLNGVVSSNSSNITFTDALSLTGSSAILTGTGIGNIRLLSTIAGAGNDLTLTAGAGSITLNSSATGIGTFTIVSGSESTISAISAAHILQLAGSTTFGALTASGALGISLTGSVFALTGNVATPAGPLFIQNTGSLTLSGTTFAIGGALTQAGLGTTTVSSQITASDVISFTGPVITSGSPTLDTSAANKAISFQRAVDGSGALGMNSGSADITLVQAVGATTRLGALTITHAGNVSAQGIRAASMTQAAGEGTTTILGNIDTTSGFNLTGTHFTINGSLLSSAAGSSSIAHTGLLNLTAGASTLLSGSFTESGMGGTVSLSGLIHASNSNITFANPITLTAAATFNSDGGGDILISSAIDGPFDLIYTAGTGNIHLAAAIGGTTPISSLTIHSAADVTADFGISSGKIIQSAGSGLTLFSGPLITTLSDGIVLAGTQFDFENAVTTTGGGIVSIAHSGSLNLPATSSFTLDGAFSELGAGAVSLCTTITTTGDSISFAGAVTLCNDATLDSDTGFGSIVFGNTVSGSHTLNLNTGEGDITFAAAVGAVPLTRLNVTSCLNLTAKDIHAGIIDIEGVNRLALFNGTLNTSNPSGVTLSGSAFTLNGNVSTSGGTLAITNSALLTIAPSVTLSIDGGFTQSGTGTIYIGGQLTTQNQPILFSGPILLTGNLGLNSNNGNITFGSDLNGPHSVTITAGTGDVTVPAAFSIEEPLVNFTVVSSHDINLNGIGSNTAFLSGALSLTAASTISLMNTTYSSQSQYYMSGADLDFIHPGLITLNTSGGPIIFASASTHLNSSTDLAINTNGGAFSFNAIHGTNFENLTINTGSGTATLGALPNIGNINTVTVNAGEIFLTAAMNLTNTAFTSQGSILNIASPVDIVSDNTASFNALGGDVGSLVSPILVHTNNLIFAGGIDLADFNGSSIDDTVHPIPSNPPCDIIWNSVLIKSCTRPIPVPVPGGTSIPASIRIVFPMPGVESSFFNLASDFYFLPYFLNMDYIRKSVLLYTRSTSKAPKLKIIKRLKFQVK